MVINHLQAPEAELARLQLGFTYSSNGLVMTIPWVFKLFSFNTPQTNDTAHGTEVGKSTDALRLRIVRELAASSVVPRAPSI